MGMNLNNFEKYINDRILTRGEDYFLSGRVEFLYRTDEEYFYRVSGSTIYNTSVCVTPDNNIYTTCDCPYDFGPICKHAVAVMYDMKANKEDYAKKNIKSIILSLTKPQLQEELLKHASECYSFGNKLFYKYNVIKNETLLNKISSTFYSFFDPIKDGRFYLDDMVNSIENIVNDELDEKFLGESILKIQEIKTYLVNLYILVNGDRSIFSEYLTQINESYHYLLNKYSKDKNLENINEIVDIIKDNFEIQVDYQGGIIPNNILEELLSLSYCDYAKQSLDVIIEGVKIESELHDYNDDFFDDDDLSEYQGDELYLSNLVLNQLDRFMYKYFLYFDNKKEADEIVDKHIADFDFFEIRIKEMLKSEQFDDARKLLEKPFKVRWYDREIAKLKIQLYVMTNDTHSLKQIYKELLIKYKTLEYYKCFKRYHSLVETKSLVDELSESDYNKSHTSNNIIEIMIFEERYEDALYILDKHSYLISQNYMSIPEKFNKLKYDIYSKKIHILASKSYGRSSYRKICYEIKKLWRLSNLSVNRIINYLKHEYSNRPAFLDELDKIDIK